MMSKPNLYLTRLICRLVVLPMVLTCFSVVTLVNPASSQTIKIDNGEEGYRRALDLLKQDKTTEALPLLEAAWRTHADNSHILADYLSALVWLGQYNKAINLYAAHKNTVAGVNYLYRNMAKAFYETKDFRQAQTLYGQAFAFDQSDAEALKGLIFCAVKLQEYHDAVRVAGGIPEKNHSTPYPGRFEGLFATARGRRKSSLTLRPRGRYRR